MASNGEKCSNVMKIGICVWEQYFQQRIIQWAFLKLPRNKSDMGFPSGSAVKNLPANAENVDSIPGLGRSAGEGNGNALQYSCLENPMNRGAWCATAHGITKVRHNLATQQLQQEWYTLDNGLCLSPRVMKKMQTWKDCELNCFMKREWKMHCCWNLAFIHWSQIKSWQWFWVK